MERNMYVYELVIEGKNKGLFIDFSECVLQVKEYYGSLFKSKNLIHSSQELEEEILYCWINCSKNRTKGSCSIRARLVK